MSVPIAPHNLVLFKIVEDFKQNDKKVHTQKELWDFSFRAMKLAETVSEEKYCLFMAGEEYLEFYTNRIKEFCDITSQHVILNQDKYYRKQVLLDERLSALNGSLLKGAKLAFEEEQRKLLKPNEVEKENA